MAHGQYKEMSLSFVKAQLCFANCYSLGDCVHEYQRFRIMFEKCTVSIYSYINCVGFIIIILILKL